jgi:uncharacterized protein
MLFICYCNYEISKLKINLEDLENNPDGQMTFNIDEIISELGNDKPVVGTITVNSSEYGVEISGLVETDVVLECDRCLNKYPYHIKIDIDEVLIKEDIVPPNTKEFEITGENFVEELKGRKEIDMTDLIYQDIILNMPGKKLCAEECPGSPELQKVKSETNLDPRMQVFKNMLD